MNERKRYDLIKSEGQMVFELHKPSPSTYYPIFYNHKISGRNLIYSFNGQDSCIDILDFKTSQKEQIFIQELLNDRISYDEKLGLFPYVESDNMIWIDSGVADSIYCIDGNSKEILSVLSKDVKNDLLLYDLMNQAYINSKTKEFVIRIYGESTKSTFGVFEINGSNLDLKKEIGFLPEIYEQKDMYVKSGVLTRLNGDSTLISYHYSDSVDLYVNHNLVKRVCMKSDSSSVFAGFEGSKMDMNAIRKYFLMNQRYNQLFYDEKNNRYYRVFSYNKKSIGKIEQSKKWSICVFDSNFNKIHEEQFNTDDNYKGYIALIDSELYIANNNESHYGGLRDSSLIVFDGYKLVEIND